MKSKTDVQAAADLMASALEIECINGASRLASQCHISSRGAVVARLAVIISTRGEHESGFNARPESRVIILWGHDRSSINGGAASVARQRARAAVRCDTEINDARSTENFSARAALVKEEDDGAEREKFHLGEKSRLAAIKALLSLVAGDDCVLVFIRAPFYGFFNKLHTLRRRRVYF